MFSTKVTGEMPEHNQSKAVRLLIHYGADRSVRDSKGRNYIDLLKVPWEGKHIKKKVIDQLSVGWEGKRMNKKVIDHLSFGIFSAFSAVFVWWLLNKFKM